MKYLLSILLLFSLGITSVLAQEEILYKEIDSTQLFLEVYYPDSFDISKNHPAMLFFFGGGWINGDRKHFLPQAKYFAKRGLVCFLADYRIENKHNTTPFESLKDAKSAIRFLRANATKFNIDPDKIIASGGSSGGHLAAATALIDGYNESSDDRSISSVPNALVLFNPVIDNGPGGYGNERIGMAYKDFSPLHNIKKETPPMILFLGTEDKLIPVETAQYFKVAMENIGNRCDLMLYEGEGHGFFNHRHFEFYKNTVLETDKFLQSLGYLKKEPFVNIEF